MTLPFGLPKLKSDSWLSAEPCFSYLNFPFGRMSALCVALQMGTCHRRQPTKLSESLNCIRGFFFLQRSATSRLLYQTDDDNWRTRVLTNYYMHLLNCEHMEMNCVSRLVLFFFFACRLQRFFFGCTTRASTHKSSFIRISRSHCPVTARTIPYRAAAEQTKLQKKKKKRREKYIVTKRKKSKNFCINAHIHGRMDLLTVSNIARTYHSMCDALRVRTAQSSFMSEENIHTIKKMRSTIYSSSALSRIAAQFGILPELDWAQRAKLKVSCCFSLYACTQTTFLAFCTICAVQLACSRIYILAAAKHRNFIVQKCAVQFSFMGQATCWAPMRTMSIC